MAADDAARGELFAGAESDTPQFGYVLWLPGKLRSVQCNSRTRPSLCTAQD